MLTSQVTGFPFALLALAAISSPAAAAQTKPGSPERAVECINARAQCVSTCPPSWAAGGPECSGLCDVAYGLCLGRAEASGGSRSPQRRPTFQSLPNMMISPEQ